MKTLKIILKTFYFLIVIFLIYIGLSLSFTFLKLPVNFNLFTVQSGSMEPSIHLGSLVFTHPSAEYQVNDVITFKSPEDSQNSNPKYTTTHRIVQIINSDSKLQYQTKGDANSTPDTSHVDQNLIIGKVIYSIPYLGYPISFARTQTGLILLIIVPSTIIIYGEILNIKNEILKLINRRQAAKDDQTSSS